MEIYILINDKPQGPYTRELVQRHLKSGQFKVTDLAAYAGSSDWQPLSVMSRCFIGIFRVMNCCASGSTNTMIRFEVSNPPTL
jgi:hypothetical protein